MIQDLTQVRNPEEYIKQILSTELTPKQLENATNEAVLENIIRHVPFIWREVFSRSVKEQGFTGMISASEAGDNLEDILNNESVKQFVQILLLIFFTMEASSEEEAGEE